MNLRRILILLVLVAALGTYLWVYEVPQAQKEGQKAKLLGVDKDAVTAITLVYPDREIALRKDDGGWRLTRPVDGPADDAAVKSLLTTVVDAEVQKTLDEMPQDLSSFGLDKPSVIVTLTLKDGSQPPPVVVGKNTAIGGKTYVRKGDEQKLYLTASTVQSALSKQAKDLRDKQLFAFQDDDASRVEIRSDRGDVTTLIRSGKDDWTIEPGSLRADPTEVRSYLSSLRATRATDFPDDIGGDLVKYGLDRPRLTVTVASGKDGAESRTLLIGGETTEGTQKQVYAKRVDQATVYTLGDWSYRGLDKHANVFRDKTVLGFDPARVGRAVVARKDGATITLARTGEGAWQVEGAEGKKTNEAACSRFLDDVRDLRGSDIAAEPAQDLAPFGLDAPDLRITLTDKDGQPIGTVLGTKRDTKYYVMRGDVPTVFEARDYMYLRLDRRQRDFLEAEPTPETSIKQGAAVSPSTTAPPGAGNDAAEEDDDSD